MDLMTSAEEGSLSLDAQQIREDEIESLYNAGRRLMIGGTYSMLKNPMKGYFYLLQVNSYAN